MEKKRVPSEPFEVPSYIERMGRRTGKIVKKKDAKRRFDGFYDPKDYFESFTTRRSPDTSILSSLHEKKPINERDDDTSFRNFLNFVNDTPDSFDEKPAKDPIPNPTNQHFSIFKRKSSNKMISSIKRNEEIMVNDTSEKKLLEILSQNPIFSNLVYSKKKSTEKNNENLMDSPDSIGKEIKELQEKYQVHMSNVKLNSLALLEDTPSVFVEKYVDKKTFIEDKKTFNEDKKTFNEDKKTFNEDKKTFIEKNIDKKSFIEKNGEIKERKKSFGTTNFVNAERFMELNKELDQMILEEERKLKRNNDRLKKNTKETEENQEKNTKEKENERKNIKENQDKNTNENEMKNIYDNKMKITEENEMKITKGKITKENQDKDTKENIENEGKKKRMSFSDPNFVNAEKLMALNNELDQLILEEEEKIKKKLEEKRRNEEKNINENLLRNEHNREESEEKEEKLEKKSKLSKKVDRFMEVDDRNEENLITEEIKEKKKLTKIKEKIQQNKEIEENKEINDEKKIIEEKKIERNPKKTKKNNKNSQENHKIDSKIDKNPAPKTRKSLKNPPKNFPKTHPKQQEIFQTEPEIAISFENSIFIDELHQTPEKNLSPTPIKPPSPAKNRIKHTKKPKTDPQSDPESNKTPIFPNKKPIIKPNSQSLDPKTLKNLKKTTKNDTNNKNNTDNSLPKPRVMKQIIKEKDFYGVTERYPARMRIPTLCYWRPINYSVSQTSDGKKIFNICEEDFDLRGGVSIDPVKKIKLNRQGKAKKIVKSNFQKEEVMDKTINYEIVKDDYDSFLVLISLKCQEKKDFGINQFGPIHCLILKCERKKLFVQVGNRDLRLSAKDTFVIQNNESYSMFNKSNITTVEISCKVIK